MPKLTTSVNKNNEENDNKKDKSIYSLSTKVEKNNDDNNTQINKDGSRITKVHKSTKVQSVSSVSDIAEWLINLTGDDIFQQLKNNPHLQLPYTDDDLNTKGWLEKAIKTIFTKENIVKMGNQIQANQDQMNNLIDEAQKAKTEKKEMLDKYNLKFKELKQQIDNAEDNKFQVEKELSSSVSLPTLISEFFRDPDDRSDELKKLISTMHSALEQKDSNVSRFILRFSKGWFVVKSTMKNFGDNEKENLEKLHNALTQMLSYISNTFISERRPLLDIMAQMCSNQFSEYDFISPEQTLQPDPEIHDASGLGNSTIKEGITFAVVRKESGKAVKYAEIKMN